MEERKGDWFLTASGIKFYPQDPRPEEINIEDIAHALSNLCRFCGHSSRFYSVAQHSVLIAWHLGMDLGVRELRLQGLLHDASEAYCGDLIRPIKYALPAYREIEDRIWEKIAWKFSMSPSLHPLIKHYDNRMLMTERRDLIPSDGHQWSLAAECPAFNKRIDPWPSEVAKKAFLEEFRLLFK